VRYVSYDSWADSNRNGQTHRIFGDAFWHAPKEHDGKLLSPVFESLLKCGIISLAMQKMFYTKYP
jgi:hypothetical protein